MLFASPEFVVFLIAVYALHLVGETPTRRATVAAALASLVLGDAVFLLVSRDVRGLWDPLGTLLFGLLSGRHATVLTAHTVAGLGAFVAAAALGRRHADALDDDRVQLPAARVLSFSLVALGLSVWLAWRVHALDAMTSGLTRVAHVPVLVLLGLSVGARRTSRGTHAARLIVLFLASAGFYHAWAAAMPGAYRYLLGLILATIALDHELALRIDAAERPATRRALLWVSLVSNLGVLGVFKYYDFALGSAAGLLDAMGVHHTLRPLALILPAGISFHTFQSLSYTIDVYQRRIRPTRSVLSLATFVLFFPQLVAGPIVRADEFLPQLARGPRVDPDRAAEGLVRIAAGLLKKLCLADVLALTLVDRVFEDPAGFSGLEVLLGVYGYALQIYLDFSAYSDIAIGAASLFGYVLPENFRAPYAAADLQDFWRRWHITLSSWLRDYLYIPLGGSRATPVATYKNLLLTMLLGGLWHGAAWTFIVWGALHGAGLAITRFFQRISDVNRERRLRHASTAVALAATVLLVVRARQPIAAPWAFAFAAWLFITPAWAAWTARLSTGAKPARVLSALLTAHYVMAAWVFFRAPSFAQAARVFTQIASASTDHVNVSRPFAAALALSLVSHLVPETVFRRVVRAFASLPPPLRALALVGVMLVLLRLSRPMVVPFIYFQF